MVLPYNPGSESEVAQSCPTLCDPMDCNPSGSSIHGIFQARVQDACMHAKSLQLCPTLCDPMDSSPPGSSVHGILYARILEWVAISFSRGSSWPRDWTRVSCIAGRCFTVWATRKAHNPEEHAYTKKEGKYYFWVTLKREILPSINILKWIITKVPVGSKGYLRNSLELPWWLSGKESTCQCRRLRFSPGLGRSPGGGNGNLLQYFCLESLWWAIVPGVLKSRTQLNTHTHTHLDIWTITIFRNSMFQSHFVQLLCKWVSVLYLSM